MTDPRAIDPRDPDPAAQLVLAFAAAAAVLLVVIYPWPGARESLFHLFNALGGVEATVGFWAGVNALADTWLALGLLLPFVLWRPRIAILLLIAAVMATLITHTLKPLLDVARPPGVYEPGMFHLIGHSISSKAFPSGHTVTAFTLAGLLIFGLRLRVAGAAAILILASVMGVSRMVAGVHWPTDVLAGSIVGLLSVWVAVRVVDRWSAARHARWPVPVAVLVTAICALGAPWVDVGYPEGSWANWLVALLGLAGLVFGAVRYWPGLRRDRFLPARRDRPRRGSSNG